MQRNMAVANKGMRAPYTVIAALCYELEGRTPAGDRQRKKNERCNQASGVAAGGCCALPSAFEKAPRTLF
jgi:hypothetical protein